MDTKGGGRPDSTYSTYSLDGWAFSPSGFLSGVAPTWPDLPWACRSHTSLIRMLLISSSVATRSWVRAGVTGDMGEGGTGLTGVWTWGGSDLTGSWRFMGVCWPFEGRLLGEGWGWGVAKGGCPVTLAGEAVWRFWANCWWAGEGMGWAKGAVE